MKKFFIVTVLTLVCSSCAYFYHPSHTAYNNKVANFVGKSVSELYKEWGYPQAAQSVSENTYIEIYYKDVSFTQLRSTSAKVGSYRPFSDKWATKLNHFEEQPMPESYNCRTSFIVVNAIIVDYSYKGYGCVE